MSYVTSPQCRSVVKPSSSLASSEYPHRLGRTEPPARRFLRPCQYRATWQRLLTLPFQRRRLLWTHDSNSLASCYGLSNCSSRTSWRPKKFRGNATNELLRGLDSRDELCSSRSSNRSQQVRVRRRRSSGRHRVSLLLARISYRWLHRYTAEHCGGSFGSKSRAYPIMGVPALMSGQLQRPPWIYSR